MSISRKIILQNVLLLTVLMVCGATVLVGMMSLWGLVRTTISEYSELRQILNITNHIVEAGAQLMRTAPDKEAATEELRQAVVILNRFAHWQESESNGPSHHELEELEVIESSISELQSLIETLATNETEQIPKNTLDRLQVIEERFHLLARKADELVGNTHSQAGVDLRQSIVVACTIFLIITAMVIIMSILQHRSVIRPLAALRRTVRQITSGRFDERVPPQGGQEFADLVGDFNQMAAQLDELYRTLGQKVEQKSRELVQSERLASVGFLAAGVAHEINNPLGIMCGYAELSLKRLRDLSDTGSRDDARKTLEIIRDEAFRCRDIIEKLLTLARDGSTNDNRVLIEGVIQDVVQMIRIHKQYKNRRIQMELPRSIIPAVRGSETELKQVLLNLAANALDATTPGEGHVCITLEMLADGAAIIVADNGHGMTREVQEHVFEPFFTSKDKGNRGIGLGLSITRAIVERYGGQIEAASDGPGHGSQFTIWLPYAPSPNITNRIEREISQ